MKAFLKWNEFSKIRKIWRNMHFGSSYPAKSFIYFLITKNLSLTETPERMKVLWKYIGKE